MEPRRLPTSAAAPSRRAALLRWGGLVLWMLGGCARGEAPEEPAHVLAALAEPFGADMDHILSAETAGVYKPHPAVYDLPEAELGIAKAEVLHVAGSPNDAMGAIAGGMACYWSNRTGDRVLDPAYPPTAEGADLTGALALL